MNSLILFSLGVCTAIIQNDLPSLQKQGPSNQELTVSSSSLAETPSLPTSVEEMLSSFGIRFFVVPLGFYMLVTASTVKWLVETDVKSKNVWAKVIGLHFLDFASQILISLAFYIALCLFDNAEIESTVAIFAVCCSFAAVCFWLIIWFAMKSIGGQILPWICQPLRSIAGGALMAAAMWLNWHWGSTAAIQLISQMLSIYTATPMDWLKLESGSLGAPASGNPLKSD